MANNTTLSCSTFGFPDELDDPFRTRTTHEVVTFSLPTAAVALVWLCLLEAPPRVHRPSSAFVRLSLAFGLLVGGAAGLLAWRIFDVLECTDVQDAERWRWIVLGAGVAAHLVLLGALPATAPRLGVVLALALAAGCVVADATMVERLPVQATPAVAPLFPLQLCFCFQAVVLLSAVPPRWRRRGCVVGCCEDKPSRPSATRVVAPVDVLAPTAQTHASPHRTWAQWPWR